MKRFFNWKVSFLVLIAALVLMPTPTHAGFGDWVAGEVFAPVSSALELFTEGVLYAIGYITAQLVALTAYFIQLMIGLSVGIMGTQIVKAGFGIVLQFTNIGFVLAIIFIAFATIFRLQGYEFKKLIKNLVIAAVLVNFSFTIAGLVMDSSHILGNFFIDAIVGGKGGDAQVFTNNLANALNVQKLSVSAPEAGSPSELASTYVKTLASLALGIIYNSAVVITFGMISGLMLVRYVALSILLIVMPIAWLCWIFPGIKKNWDEWWHHFLRWNFFLPVLMFFIYIALLSSEGVSETIKGATTGLATAQSAAGFTGFAIDLIASIGSGVVQIGILLGGLIIANKAGIAGAAGIVSATTMVKDWAQGRAVALTGVPLAGRLAKRAGVAAVVTAQTRAARMAGTALAGVGGIVTKIPGLGRVGANMMSIADVQKDARKKALEERADEINKQYAGDASFKAFMRTTAITEDEKASRALAIAKKGKIEDFDKNDRDKKTVDKYLQSAHSLGIGKKIAENRFDLMARMDPKFEIEKALREMTREEARKQRPEVWLDPKVVASADPDMLADLLKEKGMSRAKLENIISGAATLYEQKPDHKMAEFVRANTKMVGVLDKMVEKINNIPENERTDRQKATMQFHSFVIPTPTAPSTPPTPKPFTEKERAEWSEIEERKRQKEADQLAQDFPGRRSPKRKINVPEPFGPPKPPEQPPGPIDI